MKTKLLFLALLLITTLGFAQTFTDANGLNYNVLTTNPNTVEVTGGTVVNPLTFPSTVIDNGIIYTVTKIGNSAFRNKGVTEIVLPNSITTIAFRAFRDNGNLNSITLPESVTNVEGEAFSNGGLNEIIALGTIPPTISNSSFGTRSTINVTVPDGLEETYVSGGWTGFLTMNGLVPVGNIIESGDLRFRIASNINSTAEVVSRIGTPQDIIIPETITSFTGTTYTITTIGVNAFRNNTDITSMVIPSGILEIKGRAFDNVPLLTSFTSLASTPPILAGNTFNNRSIINLTVPNNQEDVYITGGWNGFASVNGVVPVGTVFTSGDLRFRVLSNDTNIVEVVSRFGTPQVITIPETVTNSNTGTVYTISALAVNAFRNTDITSIVIPSSTVEIKGRAFDNVQMLTNFTSLATTPPILANNTFNNRTTINLTVPNGQDDAYLTGGWTGFLTLNGVIPEGSGFDSGDLKFRVLSNDSNTVEVQQRVGSAQDITVPETVISSLTGDSYTVIAIGFRAFRATDITSISMPSSITDLKGQAFDNTLSLTNVSISAITPPTIESNTFQNPSIIELVVPNGTEEDYVAGGWTGFATINGEFPVGAEFIVGDLNYRVLSSNNNTVQVRNRVTATLDIVIPETVISTETGTAYTTISIGFRAFRSTDITSVALPSSITNIEGDAFDITDSLTDVSILATVPPTIATNAFENKNTKVLTVPTGREADYLAIVGWSGFFAVNGEPTPGIGFANNNLSYTTTGANPNTLRINGGTTPPDLVIPGTINQLNTDFSVTEVSIRAFDNASLNSVIFPNTLMSIGQKAFENNNITEVVFHAPLITIEREAFENNDITTITFPETLTTIDIKAFNQNPLTSIISQAIVPPTLGNTSINNRAVIDLTVPETSVDAYLAGGWTGFKTINGRVPLGSDFTDGDFIYRITSENPNTVELRGRVTTIQDIVIPDTAFSTDNNESYTVTSVGNAAFKDTDITTLSMGNSIKTIGIAAFRNCQLTSVTLSNTIETIKNDAFRNNQIENINLPNSLTTLGSFAFRSNALTFVLLPTGITTVERNTFRGNAIIAINIPSNITTIEDNAFSDNPIGFIAAEGETPATIDATSFGDRSAISLTIPTGQTVADAYTAAGWTGFASTNGGFNIGATFVIGDLIYEVIEVNPNKLTVAGAQGNVENLTIPTTATDNLTGTTFDVTEIKAEAFKNTPVTDLIIDSNIVAIGDNAFQNSGLNAITALSATPATITTSSFGDRNEINLTVPVGSETAYDTEGWTGFFSVNGILQLGVGDTFVDNNIFYEILTLAPNTLKAIGGSAVGGNFVFPDLLSKGGIDFSIVTIGNSAFRNKGARSIIFPSTLIALEFRAFRDNGNLTSITLTENITNIGQESFLDSNLTEVFSEIVNPPNVNNSTFGNRDEADLYIPAGTTQAYINAGWTGFRSIIEPGKTTLSAKVLLQGAILNPNTGEETLMRDDLRVAGLIPTTSPYADNATCSSTVFNTTGDNAIVDWVFVELRDATNNTTIVEQQSALLQRDGDIVATNGTGTLQFNAPAGNYFIVVKHRNHLGIMSASTVALANVITRLDFSDGTTVAFGTDAQTTFGMPNGTLGLWAGDASEDGRLNFLGALSEIQPIRSQVFNDPDNSVFGGPPVATYQSIGYNATDTNMDGVTVFSGPTSDTLLVRDNIFNNPSNSVFGGPPIGTFLFIQQLPEGANN